ncbi:MAG TPA: LysE family transporter [Thermodesulfobacteriota bacterium]
MMVDAGYLLRGLVIGFAIAAPVGPIGLLCIQRTLAQGRLVGLATGLGAAAADALYGFVAAFGLTAVMDLLLARQGWLRLAGAAFLAYLGARMMLAEPPTLAPVPVSRRGLVSAWASTFLLTLANPLTILAFVGIFAALGLADAEVTYVESAVLVVGVFAGSALWWLTLSGAVSLLHGKLDRRWLVGVNRISGLVILGFAAFVLARTL